MFCLIQSVDKNMISCARIERIEQMTQVPLLDFLQVCLEVQHRIEQRQGSQMLMGYSLTSLMRYILFTATSFQCFLICIPLVAASRDWTTHTLVELDWCCLRSRLRIHCRQCARACTGRIHRQQIGSRQRCQRQICRCCFQWTCLTPEGWGEPNAWSLSVLNVSTYFAVINRFYALWQWKFWVLHCSAW